MKEFILSLGVIIFSILIFACILILMLIFFIPVLPIMILAFPMTVMNQGTNKVHWSQKPYLWYFNKVWLRSLDELML